MNAERIRRESFVQSVVWVPSTASTNDDALRHATAPPPLPLLVGADQQSRGRGRGKHSWWSGSGSLTFSLLLDPEEFGVRPPRWPQLSLCTGLAICLALESWLPYSSLQLKWPNDVYAQGRKIGGVLCESSPIRPSLLVIGVGVNVENRMAEAPAEIGETAVSLCDLTESPPTREEVLIRILKELEREFRALAAEDHTQAERWRSRCFLTGRIVTVTDVATSTTGSCLGIDDDGALRLQTAHGPRAIYAGTVSVVSDPSPTAQDIQ